MMLITLTMPSRKTILTIVGWEEDTTLGSVIESDATKKEASISTPVLLKERNFITAVDLSETIHRRGPDLLNISILWPFVNLIDVLSSLLSIISYFLLIFMLILLLLSLSHPNRITLSCLIEIFTLSCFYWLFEWIWLQPCQTSLMYLQSSLP